MKKVNDLLTNAGILSAIFMVLIIMGCQPGLGAAVYQCSVCKTIYYNQSEANHCDETRYCPGASAEEIENKENTIQGQKTELVRKDSEIESLTARIAEKERYLDELELDIQNRRAELEKIQKELTSKKERLDDLELLCAKAENTIANLENEKTSLQNTLNALNETKKILEEKNSELYEANIAIKKEYEETLALYREQEEKNILLTNEIAEKINKISSLESEIDAKKVEIDAKIQEINQKNQEIAEKQNRITELDNNLKATEALLKNANIEIDTLQNMTLGFSKPTVEKFSEPVKKDSTFIVIIKTTMQAKVYDFVKEDRYVSFRVLDNTYTATLASAKFSLYDSKLVESCLYTAIYPLDSVKQIWCLKNADTGKYTICQEIDGDLYFSIDEFNSVDDTKKAFEEKAFTLNSVSLESQLIEKYSLSNEGNILDAVN